MNVLGREYLTFNEMDLVVLNNFRNQHYTDGMATEDGILADSINNVLPLLCKIYYGEVKLIPNDVENN